MATAKVYQPDQELETKVKKATERISENMHIVANEPSLAFYRLQEHVRKALPPMVEKRVEVLALRQQLQGHTYDVEYALSAIRGMEGASRSFNNTLELLKNAIFYKQQIKYEEQRRKKAEGNKDSMYKRLSAHIPALPEDLSDVVRETASRVESMMTRHSSTTEPPTTTATTTPVRPNKLDLTPNR